MSSTQPGIALCFPGQGSQRAQMADSIFEEELAIELLDVASDAGVDLASVLHDGDDSALRPTELAQPALFLVEAVLGYRLAESIDVSVAAGHSVGEYAAATVAGALAPQEAMRLVIERAKLMAAMRDGTMAAILGLEWDVVREVCAEVVDEGAGTVVVANDNAVGQLVISGTPQAVEAAGERLRQRGAKRVVPLQVSGAFHSPLMKPAAEKFAATLSAATFQEPRIPVVANVDAKPATTAFELRERMTLQLQSPVRWRETLIAIGDMGVKSVIEVGPGSVLTGLTKRALPHVIAITVNNMEDAGKVINEVAAVHG